MPCVDDTFTSIFSSSRELFICQQIQLDLALSIESEKIIFKASLAINVIGTAISNNEENIFDLSNQRLQIKHKNQFLFR